MNDSHFQHLLDLYFDEGLDASSLEDFEYLLLSDRQARSAFWEQAHLHEALRRHAGEAWGARAANRKDYERLLPSYRVAAVAALLVAMVTVWFLVSHRPTVAPPTPAVSAGPIRKALPEVPVPVAAPVAVLSEVSSAVWDSPRGLRKGKALEPGVLKLRSGMIGLTFFSGTHVMVEGPADLEILTEASMRVNRGTLQIVCPEVASGFILLTPNGLVTDQGGVFGLVVDDTGVDEITVVEGVVAMRGLAETVATELGTHGSASIGTSGRVSLHESPTRVRGNIFAKTIHAREQQRFEKWRKVSGQRAGDESLLVYLRMLDDVDSTSHLLQNDGGNPAASASAPIIAANWVAGRWPGKRALQFQSAEDRARISIKGRYPQVTFAAWIRMTDFQRPFNVLFMSDRLSGDPVTEGEVHWQFSQEGGFRFAVRPSREFAIGKKMDGRFHRAWTEGGLHPSDHGTWRHLATSYDANQKIVVHYLDGREFSRHLLAEGLPLSFGRATIGNTSYATDQYWGPRQLGGAVDEFAIYSRILDAAEIQNFYQEGKPD